MQLSIPLLQVALCTINLATAKMKLFRKISRPV